MKKTYTDTQLLPREIKVAVNVDAYAKHISIKILQSNPLSSFFVTLWLYRHHSEAPVEIYAFIPDVSVFLAHLCTTQAPVAEMHAMTRKIAAFLQTFAGLQRNFAKCFRFLDHGKINRTAVDFLRC